MTEQTALPTVDGEVVEEQQPITLFGTTDPVAVVERATTIATALADVIRQCQLTSRIGNRDHVQVEGWTLLGSMLGVFAEVEWTRHLERGWEARAVARTLNGKIVGAAEAMCTRGERTWSSRDDYAIRSMAQTRAVSKALRLPLGFIMELAGYSATPAEEMTAHEQPGRGEREASVNREAPTATTPAPTDRRAVLAAVLSERKLGIEVAEEYATLLGFPKGQRLDDEQMDRLIEAVKGHGTEAPLVLNDSAEAAPAEAGTDSAQSAPSQPEAGGSPPAAAPPAPPRPGTPEYKALSSGNERAKARKFWEEEDKKADLREREPEQLTVTA